MGQGLLGLKMVCEAKEIWNGKGLGRICGIFNGKGRNRLSLQNSSRPTTLFFFLTNAKLHDRQHNSNSA